MTSDMFGLGALSLPADFARLGWLPALGCLAWFTLTNVYSGLIYQRLTLKVPRAVVFDEIGAAAYGTAGRAMVFGSVYLTILLEPVIFHLMCMEALRQVSCLLLTSTVQTFSDQRVLMSSNTSSALPDTNMCQAHCLLNSTKDLVC